MMVELVMLRHLLYIAKQTGWEDKQAELAS